MAELKKAEILNAEVVTFEQNKWVFFCFFVFCFFANNASRLQSSKGALTLHRGVRAILQAEPSVEVVMLVCDVYISVFGQDTKASLYCKLQTYMEMTDQ